MLSLFYFLIYFSFLCLVSAEDVHMDDDSVSELEEDQESSSCTDDSQKLTQTSNILILNNIQSIISLKKKSDLKPIHIRFSNDFF